MGPFEDWKVGDNSQVELSNATIEDVEDNDIDGPGNTQTFTKTEDNNAASAAAPATEAVTSQGENKEAALDFDPIAFKADLLKTNPKLTSEEIAAQTEKAEKDFWKVDANAFGAKKEDEVIKANQYTEQFKKIAKDDFDSIAHATISTEEEYTEAISDLVEKRVNKRIETANVENDFVKALSSTDKAIFNILKNSGLDGVRQFVTPDKEIDKYMAMDSESLYIESLKTLKDGNGKPIYTSDQIAQKIAGLDENQIATEANIVRGQLNEIKMRKMAQIAEVINKDAQDRQEASSVERHNVSKQIETVLTKKSNFYGLEVDSQIAKVVAESYAKGAYDYLLKDPQFLAESILFNKIGDKAFRRYGKVKYDEGKNLNNKNDHNVSDLPDSLAAGRGQGPSGSAFSDWKV